MDSACTVSERSLDECELIAESLLCWEDCQIDTFLLEDESGVVFIVMLLRALQIFLGLDLVASEEKDLCSDQPELVCILLWDCLKHVVENLESALVVSLAKSADDRIV